MSDDRGEWGRRSQLQGTRLGIGYCTSKQNTYYRYCKNNHIKILGCKFKYDVLLSLTTLYSHFSYRDYNTRTQKSQADRNLGKHVSSIKYAKILIMVLHLFHRRK